MALKFENDDEKKQCRKDEESFCGLSLARQLTGNGKRNFQQSKRVDTDQQKRKARYNEQYSLRPCSVRAVVFTVLHPLALQSHQFKLTESHRLWGSFPFRSNILLKELLTGLAECR